MLSFLLAPHTQIDTRKVIEIWDDDEFIGLVSMAESAICITSKFLRAHQINVDENPPTTVYVRFTRQAAGAAGSTV